MATKTYSTSGKNISSINPENSFREKILFNLGPAIPSAFKELLEIIEDKFPTIPEKLKSELLSNGVCVSISNQMKQNPSLSSFVKVSVGKSDNDVDLLFTNTTTSETYKLEVKVGKNATWRGGEFSKRESDHLMISWSQNGIAVKLYACVLFLKKEDWHSNMAKGYYAPTFYKKDLAREDRIDLIGEYKGWYKTNTRTFVKIDDYCFNLTPKKSDFLLDIP